MEPKTILLLLLPLIGFIVDRIVRNAKRKEREAFDDILYKEDQELVARDKDAALRKAEELDRKASGFLSSSMVNEYMFCVSRAKRIREKL